MDLKKSLDDVLTYFGGSGICIASVSLYGSSVAGYAKPDSDVDVLVLARSFREKVRYFYFKSGGVNYSALVSDLDETYKDARSGSLGEFVVGRLLNPYVPLYGESTIREIEVEYKKRVISEEVAELYKDFQDFVYELKVPLEYFLFSKLKKRYQIYPPALYSYAKTYSRELQTRNLPMTIAGFRMAAQQLDFINLEDGHVRIKKGSKLPQMPAIDELYYFQLAIKQYLFHSKSGKVPIDVYINEFVSKFKRSVDSKEVNPYLKRPELLLSLDSESRLIWGGVEKELQANRSYRIGGALNPLYGIKVVESNGKRYVIKEFKGRSEMKWYVLGIVGRPVKPFDMSPFRRMYNEYTGSVRLRSMGISIQNIIAVHLKKKLLVKEYIEGRSLLDYIREASESGIALQLVAAVAGVLRRIHDAGFAMGDSKPENFLVSGDKVYIVDLEQFRDAADNEDKGWDVSEFVYYSLSFIKKDDLVRKFLESFREGYGEAEEIYRRAVSTKFLLPFLIMSRPDELNRYRSLMQRTFLGGYNTQADSELKQQ
ncbi:MAG: nucleotidyltransferase domain-containing protein [Nitrososphaeria archaeon]